MINKYPLLNSVSCIEDYYRIPSDDLQSLAGEIRQFIIESVSKCGGHLASNLGAVELTLALHRVFKSPSDKIVWDVGHQCYTHKILTGRKDDFASLRQLGGMSGFPKRAESPHDVFNTGHSSTSVSAALGMCMARDLKREKYHVVSVIGDGALTGGMAFEALNHAGQAAKNFMVILNDNQMSISPNVGALANTLNTLRSAAFYEKVKRDLDVFLNKIPGVGSSLANAAHLAKDSVKYAMIGSRFFEEIGFKYIGPVDGHDILELIKILGRLRKIEQPVLLHICTTKGKGYDFAENSPDKFHGIGEFDVKTGEAVSSTPEGRDRLVSASEAFGDCICRIARSNKSITAITASMPKGTGLVRFSREFPERFFDVGIAEQHAVTFAAGLAAEGMSPVAAIYSTFLQRAYDQVVHDVCLQKLHVVFMVDRAGVVGCDGQTHQGIFDLSYLTHMPNMSVLAPSSTEDLRQMFDYSVNCHSFPIAIRYPSSLPECLGSGISGDFKFGCAKVVKYGSDITVVAVGGMLASALKAAELSSASAEVIDPRTVKPIDFYTVAESVKKTGRLLVIEDNCTHGGAGSMLETLFPEYHVHKMGYPTDVVPEHSTIDETHRLYGLDAASIAVRIDNICTKVHKAAGAF